MNFYEGLHVILINDSQEAAYSGMTPGYIQGFYKEDEAMIDLQRLCFNAGATFINDEVIQLDREFKKIILKNQPSIHYDLLSINTGSISKKNNLKIEKNAKYIFIKPINNLIQNLKNIDQLTHKNNLIKLSIIGGGVAAFELGFALRQRYQSKVSLTIFSRHMLSEKNLNTKSILKLKQISKKMNITLIEENVLEIN